MTPTQAAAILTAAAEIGSPNRDVSDAALTRLHALVEAATCHAATAFRALILNVIAAIPSSDEAGQRDAAQLVEAWDGMGWQPIETAPKDGTRVLIFENRPIKFWAIARWIGAPHNHWGDGFNSWRPTHWQPLPAPPSPQERK